MPLTRQVLAFAAVLVLAGCAPMQMPQSQSQPQGFPVEDGVSVRDLVAQQDDYVASHFSLANLDHSVLEAISRVDTEPLHFHTITLVQSGVRSDSERPNYTLITKYTALGNGVVQEVQEESGNEGPNRHFLALSYRGLVDLLEKSVPLFAEHPHRTLQARPLEHVDAIPLSAGAESVAFSFKYTLTAQGLPRQVSSEYDCRTGTVRAAREIAPNLAGEAVAISCESPGPGALMIHRYNYQLLRAYGLVYQESAGNPNPSDVKKVVSIEVQGTGP
jgi:hypothetical protein